MTERLRFRRTNRVEAQFPQERAQFRKILEKGLREKEEGFPLSSMIDPMIKNVSLVHSEPHIIGRIYNWLNLMLGELRDEQDNQEFTDYLGEVWNGIERTMRPKEEKGQLAKTIEQMKERQRRIHQKYEPHSLEFPSATNLGIRADMLGTSLAINYSRRTIQELQRPQKSH